MRIFFDTMFKKHWQKLDPCISEDLLMFFAWAETKNSCSEVQLKWYERNHRSSFHYKKVMNYA